MLHSGPGLELTKQERRQELRWQIARSEIHPGVLVHLAAEELTAIGALLAQDLGALREMWIVQDQGPALAAADVLRFVKTQRRHRAERTQGAPAPGSEEPVRVVLDDRQAVSLRHRADDVHGAAHAGVVHRHDGACARRDQRLELPFVEIEGVGADVGEHRHRAAQREGVGARDEGERGQDDFIARLEVEQKCRELERMRAGRGEQSSRCALARRQDLLQERVTPFGERAIAREMTAVDCALDVRELIAHDGGAVEGNRNRRGHDGVRC